MRLTFYVVGAVVGLALVGGAVKLYTDMKAAADEAPRPRQPWERLP
jgi:hypothetical protein